MYKCPRCGGLSAGKYCARMRCHGVDGEISAKPIECDPIEVVLKEDYDRIDELLKRTAEGLKRV